MAYTFNPADVHVDQALTEISIRYQNGATIWRNVAPLVNVGKRSDKYYVFNPETAFNALDDSSGPLADANEIILELSTSNYSVNDRALAAWVPVEAIDNADDPVRPEADAVMNIRDQLENRHELRVAASLFAAATYASANKETLSGTSRWSQSASTPIDDILGAMDTLIVRPNQMTLGPNTWRFLRQHADILAAVYPMGGNAVQNGGAASIQAVASFFGLDQINVGYRRTNTAGVGATPSYSYVWGDHALLHYTNPRPQRDSVSLAYTFSESQSNIVREFDAKKGVKGAVYVKDGWNEDVVVVAADTGYLFVDAGDNS